MFQKVLIAEDLDSISIAVVQALHDDELSPSQQKNISKIVDCKVLDRTNLILDIFAQIGRAHV